MYIIKHAIRSISRSKGRSFLIGTIIFVISASSCIALSIRAAAHTAEETALDGLTITAQISANRQKMMESADNQENRKEALGTIKELTLEELELYAEAESVKSFYYTASASINGSSLEPIDSTGVSDQGSDTSSDTSKSSDSPDGQQNMPEEAGARPGGGKMGTQGDFTITGYSSDEAMTSFLNGTESIKSGTMFAESTDDASCVISEELATYNDLSVGDTITLANPNNEEETYTLTISGIYTSINNGNSFSNMMGGFSTAADTANQIYVSYQTLETLSNSWTSLQTMLNGTYTFTDSEDYEDFQDEAYELGLSEDYTISSTDLDSYEQSIEPLQNLSKYAGYFLIVILLIGGIILIVLNIFNIRERKYEIGVLSAIGMKKHKISLQFLTELLCITFCSLIIGAGVGAVSSVPLTNVLLSQQVENSAAASQEQTAHFGREPGSDSHISDPTDTFSESSEIPEDIPDQQSSNLDGQIINGMTSYIDSVSSATNFIVIIELVGIGLLLTAISGLTAIVFIMRYDPLRILSSRD